ncbi:MAG: hypothetical protein C4291_14930 [Candidatus Dadabacteria bacterium]
MTPLATAPVDASAPTIRRPAWRSAVAETERQAQRKRRLERFEQVRALRKQAMPIKRIAKTLHMSRVTVRTYLKAEAFPEMAPRRRASRLDPYLPHLQQRWRQGCRNATQLWCEIHEQGFPGTRRQVEKWVCVRREEPRRYSTMTDRRGLSTSEAAVSQLPVPPAADKLPAPKKLAWLLLKTKNTLDDSESALLQRIRQHPTVALSYQLAQRFVSMIRTRASHLLTTWLVACERSQVPDLVTFATGLRADFAAVHSALKLKWSNGQLEGQVNRLKLIKRQMDGRANFDLLRIRVLTPI